MSSISKTTLRNLPKAFEPTGPQSSTPAVLQASTNIETDALKLFNAEMILDPKVKQSFKEFYGEKKDIIKTVYFKSDSITSDMVLSPLAETKDLIHQLSLRKLNKQDVEVVEYYNKATTEFVVASEAIKTDSSTLDISKDLKDLDSLKGKLEKEIADRVYKPFIRKFFGSLKEPGFIIEFNWSFIPKSPLWTECILDGVIYTFYKGREIPLICFEFKRSSDDFSTGKEQIRYYAFALRQKNRLDLGTEIDFLTTYHIVWAFKRVGVFTLEPRPGQKPLMKEKANFTTRAARDYNIFSQLLDEAKKNAVKTKDRLDEMRKGQFSDNSNEPPLKRQKIGPTVNDSKPSSTNQTPSFSNAPHEVQLSVVKSPTSLGTINLSMTNYSAPLSTNVSRVPTFFATPLEAQLPEVKSSASLAKNLSNEQPTASKHKGSSHGTTFVPFSTENSDDSKEFQHSDKKDDKDKKKDKKKDKNKEK